MFGGEESVRIKSNRPPKDFEDAIDSAFGRIGAVDFVGRGRFEVSPKKFRNIATDVVIDGEITKGRREGEWTIRISYNVQPSAMCWVIAVVGFILCLVGPVVLIMPFLAKSEVQRAIERATREAQEEIEEMGETPFVKPA